MRARPSSSSRASMRTCASRRSRRTSPGRRSSARRSPRRPRPRESPRSSSTATAHATTARSRSSRTSPARPALYSDPKHMSNDTAPTADPAAAPVEAAPVTPAPVAPAPVAAAPVAAAPVAAAPAPSSAPQSHRPQRRDIHGMRGPRRDNRSRDQSQSSGDGPSMIEKVVFINRCAKVVKGGRRFSFAALTVVGDQKGNIGVGYGKANEVPDAIKKSTEHAKKRLMFVKLKGDTIPHDVIGEFDGGRVLLKPASPG